MVCTPTLSSEADAALIERRRPQFSSEPGHLFIPAPYSINGIGEGVVFFGSAYNIADSYTDVFAIAITGDLEGFGAGATDYHFIDKRLFFDFTAQQLSKALIQSYSGRGMDTSSDDHIFVELDKVFYTGGKLTLSFARRMFELYAIGYDGSFSVASLRDEQGKTITGTSDSAEDHFNLYGLGMVVDLTDDRSDPRKGIRLDTSLGWSPPKDTSDADYIVMDNNLTLYLPVGKRSTWAFNLFSSDALMQEEGETDRTVIEAELGFQCSLITDPVQQAECQQSADEYIDNIIAANRHGTATSLGGRSRLRSFPEDRYKGAHAAFIGTEFRWNLTQESTPFNIGIIKDVRTGVQLAFFHEIGTVAESSGDLWKDTRTSTGLGFRVVNASGLIYRIDYATGDEGESLTVIINYPWEAF